ncbi:leucine-rich repeat-containing protein 58-like [Liolophura sinensis]|uniref:leucine-rich repeat-containing protein 58-like n=1 Tax=Liolophura sinensis TaxID=3198878 RepID=UPI00315968C0
MASPGSMSLDGLSSCSSSDSEFHGENAEDLSFSELDAIPEFLMPCAHQLKSLQLDHNSITVLPRSIAMFKNLITLDLSNNQMSHLSSELCSLSFLRTLSAKNNLLDTESIPKDFGSLQALEILNFSGNGFIDVPIQITELSRLRSLYMGQNCLKSLPSEVKHLTRLQNLYLGGNQLSGIPAEVGQLQNLACLVLCDNQLQSLPPTLVSLRRLQSLSLHNNCLSTLPPEIVSLNLVELSLRNNPLIMKFVQEMVHNPPSLLELSGRTIKSEKVKYSHHDLPGNLLHYLESAHRCVNPKCKGVYFSARVEHVKFVDFCGKYRIPLMQYLCSPQCTAAHPSVQASESDTDDDDSASQKIRKVLLG